ncbi:unnamed protein product [Chrysoparadoxa australica]
MSSFQFNCVELNLDIPTEFFGRFVFKSIEVGHGITIGNILRRVLLKSLSSTSIVGVRFAGINHEFSTLPGLREDILEILLNLKGIIFKTEFETASFGRLKVQGPAIVTAADLQFDEAHIQIVNEKEYICTIIDNSILELEVKLAKGKGYVLSEHNELDIPQDFIKVDAIFMPIRKVNYEIIQDITDNSETVLLDVWTNGSILPNDAVSKAAQIILDWINPIKNLNQEISKPHEVIEKVNNLNIPIEDLYLSVRAYNGLKRANINNVSDLQKYSILDLKDIKNFGNKSIHEVISVLENKYGIKLQ